MNPYRIETFVRVRALRAFLYHNRRILPNAQLLVSADDARLLISAHLTEWCPEHGQPVSEFYRRRDMRADP